MLSLCFVVSALTAQTCRQFYGKFNKTFGKQQQQIVSDLLDHLGILYSHIIMKFY